ncbi:DUF6913 domain-containing protein [Aquiflexum sp.]|uniref:DUF6913 domain-containing protein n=1 Tax=Aquiflexum sp. TaxID=1872584 RepID=UPI0035935FEF
MKFIKNLFINFQLKNSLKRKRGYDVKVPANPKCVGILAENEDEFVVTKEFIRSLWGYQVRIIGFYYHEQNQETESISHKHFSLTGLPGDYCNGFLDEKLDFILVPSLSLNPYLRYLLLNNRSRFKMGFLSDENKTYLDFMIKMEGNGLNENLINLMAYFEKLKQAC